MNSKLAVDISCIVCDDEMLARQGLVDLIERRSGWKIAGQAENSGQLLRQLNETCVDVIFLDINMPGISGIEIARTIKEKYPATEIVFITAFDAYAIRAFELYALDYILKPYSENRIYESLIRAESVFHGKSNKTGLWLQRLFIPSITKITLVDLDDVLGFESNGNYVDVILHNKVILHRASMNYLEENLDPAVFSRCHRSCIVRHDAIKVIHSEGNNKYSIVLDNNKSIKMSMTYKDKLMNILSEKSI